MTGEFGFLVTANGDIEATIDASINILGNTLDVEGGAGIYFGDNRGFAAAITLTLGAGFSGAGFSLTGAFTLKVNTSQIDRTFSGVTAEAYSAEISIAGTLSLLSLIDATGSVTIKLSGSGFSFELDASIDVTPLGTFVSTDS